MIVLVKDKHYQPLATLEEAQEKVNAGWNVHINKTGKKLVKAAKKTTAKKTTAKKTTKKKGDK